MSFNVIHLHFLALILLPVLVPTLTLNTDGVLLLSFRYSILSDPLSVLQNWNYDDETPCSWNGVNCSEMGLPGTPDTFRVTSLLLPNSQLLGSISPDLGCIEHLRHLDLSNNFFNGSLPDSIFNATDLQVISLSGNVISGELPGIIGGLKGLELFNLSDNALAGNIPENLTALKNLTVLSLRTNHFSGSVPGGFSSVQVLDLSSNLLNESLPLDFGGENLRYLNLSRNKISGSISAEFAKTIPGNATIDLSFNNLTGAIPESVSLLNQKVESFRGNVDLCGKPLETLCTSTSTLPSPPNRTTISPAVAVIPKPPDSASVQPNSKETQMATRNQAQTGLKPSTIVAITAANLAGIALLAIVIIYLYQLKRRKATLTADQTKTNPPRTRVSKADNEPRKPAAWSCLTIKNGGETSETTTSDSDYEYQDHKYEAIEQSQSGHNKKGGKLVMVDGETELETETLLKSSAYILGASGTSIVYKAVLADGTAFAVRRIGEGAWAAEKFRDFEIQVRLLAKLRHPNLVRIRGFYWGIDEQLVIYDYVSNGNLATVCYRKPGSSPSHLHLSLEVRLKIARGVARGLAFIHEKKCVHGSIQPSNILLNIDMEPIISDFGLDRLVSGNNTNIYKASNSGPGFGSLRSMASTSQDHPVTASPQAPSTATGSSAASSSPYQPPESLKNLKPNPKWDVYSFGIVLLELLTGRVFPERELSQWTAGSMLEDKNRVSKLADVAIRSDAGAKEDALAAGLKLGFSCASAPQKRPSMKEALQILQKISNQR